MQKAYSVAQVNTYIKNMFAQDFMLQSLSVKGELSNVKYHSSGHIYFTLKDKSSVIACVMFAGNRAGLSFSLQEGMQVIVTGSIAVYERDGRYQLYAKQIEQDGLGELYEKFERLKQELGEQGLFAPEYKQPIPAFTKRLGVVTAPTGAAVRDIISIAKTRNPYIEIILYPAQVQGEGAAASIVKGIKKLEEIGVDTIIVGRGGGSIEDLWAFNEEIVAQAIFDCSIPIISAVGHETDTTISDFVADRRAETPSAAAQIAVCEVANIENQLESIKAKLEYDMCRTIELYRNRVELKKINLNRLSPTNQIKDKRFRTMQCEDAMKNRMIEILNAKKNALKLVTSRLNGVSPLIKLEQGLSYTKDKEGGTIRKISQVKAGDDISIYVSDGCINAQVVDTVNMKW